LDAAACIGATSGANILGLHVCPDPMRIVAQAASSQFGTSLGSVELIHAIQRDSKKREAAARQTFDAFAERVSSGAGMSQGQALMPSWQDVEDDPVDATIAAARYADLVVIGRAPKNGELAADHIASILVKCGRPLLLVPEQPVETVGLHIAVAWKETAEAARAVTAAMPLLSRAKRVAVISASEPDSVAPQEFGSAARLAEQLSHHGFSPEAQDISVSALPVSETLIRAARGFGADLLVAGAYSHSRFRELVFGGFTRQVLHACDLPVLLLH
jgi:nucleotide-binding universal stress UspA family protein